VVKSRIAYTKPSITDLEVRYCAEAAREGWGPRCYEFIEKFELAFKNHLGVKYAIATSSCTGALHMGLAAVGLEPGDEVILADSNWIATVAPVVHLGARPVFVDILEDSWCLDPTQVQAAITPRTKAIIATHLYGNLCDMERLLAIAQQHEVALIEDAAEAIGSIYFGKRAGSMGRFGCFSFHGSKTITTGEGGMFVTNDDELYQRVMTLANHGRVSGQVKQFWPEVIGYKFKMSNVQAAIGLAQLERVSELVARKREIFYAYRDRFGNIPGVSMNPEPRGTQIGAWMPTLIFAKETGVTREQLQAAFRAENIDARVFFYPLSSLPMFLGAAPSRLATDIPGRAINLPSYHDMTSGEQTRVAEVVCAALKAHVG
jgi:perosamine synthetase